MCGPPIQFWVTCHIWRELGCCGAQSGKYITGQSDKTSDNRSFLIDKLWLGNRQNAISISRVVTTLCCKAQLRYNEGTIKGRSGNDACWKLWRSPLLVLKFWGSPLLVLFFLPLLSSKIVRKPLVSFIIGFFRADNCPQYTLWVCHKYHKINDQLSGGEQKRFNNTIFMINQKLKLIWLQVIV